jgi:signal peptidase I
VTTLCQAETVANQIRPWRVTSGARLFAATLTLALSLLATMSGQASANGQTVTFSVPSGSMEPTIPIGSTVTVNRLAYRHHPVRAGDIVVFADPPVENCGGAFSSDLIKRVIGVPGETISLSGGYVFIDGKRLHETWLPSSVRGTTFPGPARPRYNLTEPYKIPHDDYFALGDNRTDSCDSRYFGPIAKVLIVGKVKLG